MMSLIGYIPVEWVHCYDISDCLHYLSSKRLQHMSPNLKPKDVYWYHCTVMPRYNAVVGRQLLGPPYKRGALWDPVDLFNIVIPRQSQGTGTQRPRPRLEVKLVYG